MSISQRIHKHTDLKQTIYYATSNSQTYMDMSPFMYRGNIANIIIITDIIYT